MKSFVDSLLTAFAIVFIIPTTLILISWNAIPGDRLYGLKRGLESVALALTKNTPIASAFSLEFTDRRFSEANILLSKKGSTLGYTYLVNEASQTKDIIVDKKDTKKAQELIKKIDEYQKSIEERKIVLRNDPSTLTTTKLNPSPQKNQPSSTQPSSAPVLSSPTTTSSQAEIKTNPPTIIQTPAPNSASGEPQPAENVDTAINDLENTTNRLEEIKKDIEKQLPVSASERAIEQQHTNEQRKEDKKENHDNK